MEIDAMQCNQPNKNQNNQPPQPQQKTIKAIETGFQRQPPQVNVSQQFASRPIFFHQQGDYLRKNNWCFCCRRLGHNRMNYPAKNKLGHYNSTTYKIMGREMPNNGYSIVATTSCCHPSHCKLSFK